MMIKAKINVKSIKSKSNVCDVRVFNLVLLFLRAVIVRGRHHHILFAMFDTRNHDVKTQPYSRSAHNSYKLTDRDISDATQFYHKDHHIQEQEEKYKLNSPTSEMRCVCGYERKKPHAHNMKQKIIFETNHTSICSVYQKKTTTNARKVFTLSSQRQPQRNPEYVYTHKRRHAHTYAYASQHAYT